MGVFSVFYDEELEEISDIKMFIKKGNRYKEEKGLFTTEEKVDIDYITSKKMKFMFVPPESEVKITYSVKCNELMYLADHQ